MIRFYNSLAKIIFLLALVFVFTLTGNAADRNRLCDEDGSWIEKLICKDKKLAGKALKIDQALSDLRAVLGPGERSDLKFGHASWERSLGRCKKAGGNDEASSAECLNDMFAARIKTLEARLQTYMPEKEGSQSALEIHKETSQEGAEKTETKSEDEKVSEGNAANLSKEEDNKDGEKRKTRQAGRAMPEHIEPDKRVSPIIKECDNSELPLPACLIRKKEEREKELLAVSAKLLDKLKKSEVSEKYGSFETSFEATEKYFRQYRQNHCQWLSSVTGDQTTKDNLYRSCYAEITGERIAILQEILAAVP
jgi:uncharacterized protein